MHRPNAGVGVFVVSGNKMLLEKRKGIYGGGIWPIPRGCLEINEILENCAKKEVFEEKGFETNKADKINFTNDIFEGDKKHYSILALLAKGIKGVLRLKEPEKFDEWKWYGLLTYLFIPLQNLLKQCFKLNDFLESKK
jgi:8-oxo-dGTP diphosphatase